MMLFEAIAWSRWFQGMPMTLVLTNEAGFRAKLQSSPMSSPWRDFKGDAEEEALEFLKAQYAKAANGRELFYSCVYELTDDKDVERFVEYVEQTVLGESR